MSDTQDFLLDYFVVKMICFEVLAPPDEFEIQLETKREENFSMQSEEKHVLTSVCIV